MDLMLAAKKTLTCILLALCGTWTVSASALASTGGTAFDTTPTPHAATLLHHHGKHSGEQIATWFGPGFYGQKTACGQTMTPQIVGVASRKLPCGTLVLVSYEGHQLTVPVIDRGPYAHNGATWDLTWGAANALSIEDTVWVKTKVTGQTANTPLLGAPVRAPAVQATVTPSGGTSAG
jgi:rare lipoprotein A (peptidoglycan hydrolase)